jgi:hypothetical protein
VSISSNIDFVLTVGDDEDVYLACECKRLNVPYKSGIMGLDHVVVFGERHLRHVLLSCQDY